MMVVVGSKGQGELQISGLEFGLLLFSLTLKFLLSFQGGELPFEKVKR